MKFFVGLACSMAFLLAAFLAQPRLWRDAVPPEDPLAAARWMASHPVDWNAAAALTDNALDARSDKRFALWRAAYDAASHLAPLRPSPRTSFVRAGLFHWYELGDGDRKAVVAALEPMLRDPQVFSDMYLSLWSLTRDFELLRRANPHDVNGTYNLRELAVIYGRFDDYRALRGELRNRYLAEFEQRRDRPPADLLTLVPNPIDDADTPLIQAILNELHRRPLDNSTTAMPMTSALVEFALDRDLKPVDGLDELARADALLSPSLRARLALRLGHTDLASRIAVTNATSNAPDWRAYHRDRALFEARHGDLAGAEAQLLAAGSDDPQSLETAAEVAEILGNTALAAQRRTELASKYGDPKTWDDTCSGDLCRSAYRWIYASAPRTVSITMTLVQSDEVPPYVEVFLDGARVAEAAVTAQGAGVHFEIPSKGLHKIEVRLVNRFTRNHTERRVRLS